MSAGNPYESRVRAQFRRPQRDRIGAQLSEDAALPRKRVDPAPRHLVNIGGDEPLKLAARPVQHTERRVPSARHVPRGRDHPLEHDVEIEIAEGPAGELHQLTHIGKDRSLPISHRTAASHGLRSRRNRDGTIRFCSPLAARVGRSGRVREV